MNPYHAEAPVAFAQIPEHLFDNPALFPQRQLLERILGVLAADERFLTVWISGSFGRDEGDAQSDLDLHAAVADDAHAGLVTNWVELIDRISATILKRKLQFGGTTVLNAIIPDWRRFDLTLEPVSDLGRAIGSPRLLLFDRNGVSHRLGPLTPEPTVGAEAVRTLIEDFIRVLGLLPVVINRGEFLTGVDGAMLLRRYLIDLMLSENGVSRLGAFRLNQLLFPNQRAVLEQLPPCIPTRESVIEFHLACARVFDPIARRLLSSRGVDYPEEFHAATRLHLDRSIGVRF